MVQVGLAASKFENTNKGFRSTGDASVKKKATATRSGTHGVHSSHQSSSTKVQEKSGKTEETKVIEAEKTPVTNTTAVAVERQETTYDGKYITQTGSITVYPTGPVGVQHTGRGVPIIREGVKVQDEPVDKTRPEMDVTFKRKKESSETVDVMNPMTPLGARPKGVVREVDNKGATYKFITSRPKLAEAYTQAKESGKEVIVSGGIAGATLLLLPTPVAAVVGGVGATAYVGKTTYDVFTGKTRGVAGATKIAVETAGFYAVGKAVPKIKTSVKESIYKYKIKRFETKVTDKNWKLQTQTQEKYVAEDIVYKNGRSAIIDTVAFKKKAPGYDIELAPAYAKERQVQFVQKEIRPTSERPTLHEQAARERIELRTNTKITEFGGAADKQRSFDVAVEPAPKPTMVEKVKRFVTEEKGELSPGKLIVKRQERAFSKGEYLKRTGMLKEAREYSDYTYTSKINPKFSGSFVGGTSTINKPSLAVSNITGIATKPIDSTDINTLPVQSIKPTNLSIIAQDVAQVTDTPQIPKTTFPSPPSTLRPPSRPGKINRPRVPKTPVEPPMKFPTLFGKKDIPKFSGSSKKKSKPGKRYNPTLYAVSFNLKGKRPKGKLTGLEQRPI